MILNGGAVGPFLERFLVDEQGADHRGRGRIQQHRSKPACLDFERGVKGHQRPFVNGGKQRLRSRVDTFCLAVDHGGGADECHETCGVIGRAAGHLVALCIPRLYQICIGCVQHPFPGRCHGISGDFVDDAGGLGLSRRERLSFQQEWGRAHRAKLAHEACRAACAREDANHDLWQANLGLWIVGGEDPVAGQGDFKANAERRAWQNAGNRLAALEGLGVHAGAFDLAQGGMDFHDAGKNRGCRVIAAILFHFGKHVQVHPGGKAVLAGCQDDAFDGVICQCCVDQAIEFDKAFFAHDVHGLGLYVPRDCGDAVRAGLKREIGHFLSS